jgi:hypothetical protein
VVGATRHSVSHVGVFDTSIKKGEFGLDESGNVFIRVTKPDGSFVGVTLGMGGTISYW